MNVKQLNCAALHIKLPSNLVNQCTRLHCVERKMHFKRLSWWKWTVIMNEYNCLYFSGSQTFLALSNFWKYTNAASLQMECPVISANWHLYHTFWISWRIQLIPWNFDLWRQRLQIPSGLQYTQQCTSDIQLTVLYLTVCARCTLNLFAIHLQVIVLQYMTE